MTNTSWYKCKFDWHLKSKYENIFNLFPWWTRNWRVYMRGKKGYIQTINYKYTMNIMRMWSSSGCSYIIHINFTDFRYHVLIPTSSLFAFTYNYWSVCEVVVGEGVTLLLFRVVLVDQNMFLWSRERGQKWFGEYSITFTGASS